MHKRGKTEKLSVTLPMELTEAMRSIVAEGGISSFLADALEHFLAYRKQKLALKKGFGAWKTEHHPELASSRNTAPYIRALRDADSERLASMRVADGK